MQKIIKQSIIIIILATLIVVPFGTSALAEYQSQQEDISAGAMAADLLFGRPLGIAAIVVGSVVFVVSLPFSALGGNVKDASQKLIKDPVNFTFKRALGDF